MSMEVEETIKRIQSHKGVKGVLIMNDKGHAIRSNFSPEDTDNYASLVSQVNHYALPFCSSVLKCKSFASVGIKSGRGGEDIG